MNFEVNGERTITRRAEENILEIVIPIKLLRRGGRTHISTPNGQTIPENSNYDTALMRALAQGHIWLKKLESGKYKDVKDLAQQVNRHESYVSRIIRLTTLSPSLQEDILMGRDIGGRTLADFIDGFSPLWSEQ